MSFDLKQFFAIIAANSIIVFLARHWFLEQLRQSIKSEYDTKLETLKAKLSSDNNSKLEQLKISAAKELEEARHVLQREIEEYRVSANSSVGAKLNLSASVQQMVQTFAVILDNYGENIFVDDEIRLEKCGKSLQKASRDLDHALLSISESLENEIRTLIKSYDSEFEAFAACLEVKKIRAGVLKSSYDPNNYDHAKAREEAQKILSGLESDWHAIKNKLRQLVSSCGEE
jgi:DNA anti-recombination protein RmuC